MKKIKLLSGVLAGVLLCTACQNKGPQKTWYIDADRDGYGSAKELSSEQPENGYALSSLKGTGIDDCDDSNKRIHPGAIDILGDGLDNNCDGIVDNGSDIATAVIQNYAAMVHQNYTDCYTAALVLQESIEVFTQKPSKAGLKAAKEAWLQAREFYGQTEVYRGSNGPIDFEGTEDEPWALSNEGQINAWPLDEGYIDYVKAGSEAYAGSFENSIISGDQVITKEFLAGVNEGAGTDLNMDAAAKAVSTGWHAIEFLLWGQDETAPAKKMPGQRPYTDYTTAAHKERRIQYLNVVTALLVDDLKKLSDTWSDEGAYRKVFMSLPTNEAITNIISGPHFLAAEELSNERMLASATSDVGIDGSGQEDEHSCFSDNTHRDVYRNAQGILNVLFGNYEDGYISGTSLYDLIKEADTEKAASLKAAADKAWASIVRIDTAYNEGTPYDLLITQESANNPGLVLDANQDLMELGNVISEAIAVYGVNLY